VGDLIARRKFITGAAALSLLAGCESRPAGAFLGLMRGWNERFEELLFSPRRLAPELPESATTPEEDFPQYFISAQMPSAPPNWNLAVGGLVRHPLTLTLAELQRLPPTEMRVQHHCVEGWSAVAAWRGVRVSEIARIAGLDPRVRYVEFRSFDANYYSGWDLASATHQQTLLAYGMNGHPLEPGHGAPLRLYSAIKLGYKNVKYLTAINFLPNKPGGYWEDQGYEWFAGV
jgi:DMSO/TMAO reductase YedYZ molybdopterin-dependent catalytic subunit